MKTHCILGIDTATINCGYALLSNTNKPKIINFGVLKAKKSLKLGYRLMSLSQQYCHYLDSMQKNDIIIDKVVFEIPFINSKNFNIIKSIFKCVGILQNNSLEREINIDDINVAKIASLWKIPTRTGRDIKKKITILNVRTFFSIKDSITITDDEADAISLALYSVLEGKQK